LSLGVTIGSSSSSSEKSLVGGLWTSCWPLEPTFESPSSSDEKIELASLRFRKSWIFAMMWFCELLAHLLLGLCRFVCSGADQNVLYSGQVNL